MIHLVLLSNYLLEFASSRLAGSSVTVFANDYCEGRVELTYYFVYGICSCPEGSCLGIEPVLDGFKFVFFDDLQSCRAYFDSGAPLPMDQEVYQTGCLEYEAPLVEVWNDPTGWVERYLDEERIFSARVQYSGSSCDNQNQVVWMMVDYDDFPHCPEEPVTPTCQFDDWNIASEEFTCQLPYFRHSGSEVTGALVGGLVGGIVPVAVIVVLVIVVVILICSCKAGVLTTSQLKQNGTAQMQTIPPSLSVLSREEKERLSRLRIEWGGVRDVGDVALPYDSAAPTVAIIDPPREDDVPPFLMFLDDTDSLHVERPEGLHSVPVMMKESRDAGGESILVPMTLEGVESLSRNLGLPMRHATPKGPPERDEEKSTSNIESVVGQPLQKMWMAKDGTLQSPVANAVPILLTPSRNESGELIYIPVKLEES